ncbi:MAG: NUDIX domain-containing protein [Saprospiraceae bacterium]|nr:NUDIX domain-containing protein [Bacteroidia bacterium]MBT8229679.1 NUDIX domain-containing protein [Bacteroidia bacterium]NNF21639.1 NUDIX domain-containing protein [Saprospiraceae bacterium]NNK90497.1 NUDIX domain-containing protein [Saprospiraceae bacterium]
MYKIYINDNVLLLADSAKLKPKVQDINQVIAPYSGNKKMLLAYIDMLEKTDRFDEVIIHYQDLDKLKDDFKSLFVIVHAAGGIVLNEKEEILVIKRLGLLDLPKGKLDEGEKKKDAASREVEEETGISNLKRHKKFSRTRHTYRTSKGKRVLKISHWYYMTAPDQDLIPQEEENITEARWMPVNFLETNTEDIYPSIRALIERFKTKYEKKYKNMTLT